MAVSVEAAFLLVDRASSTLKRIEANALATDKALKGMGGGSAGIDKVTKSSKQMGAEFDKAGKNVEQSIGHFKNLTNQLQNTTRALLQAHPAVKNFSMSLGGLAGGLKGAVTAFPLMIQGAIAATAAIQPLIGVLGALVGSLGQAVGGAAFGAVGVGGGLIGSFAVGLGSIVAVGKPAITALTNYKTAVTSLNTAMASGNPATIKKAQENVNNLAKQTPGIAALNQTLTGFTSEWKKATAPGQAQFFQLATSAINDLRKDMSFLGPEANKNVAALRQAFEKQLGPFLTGDQFKGMVTTLGSVFRANLPGLIQGVINLFGTFDNILKIFLPTLTKVGTGFADLTGKLERWTASARGVSVIKSWTESFKDWMRLLGGVARLIGIVTGAGATQGTSMIKSWADSINKFADTLKGPKGQAGLQSFYQQAIDQANKLWPVLKDIAGTLMNIYKAWRPLGDAYIKVIDGVSKLVNMIPAPALTAVMALWIGGKALTGAIGTAQTVKGVFGKVTAKGDTPTNPLYVMDVSAGLGGGGGAAATAERGLRARFAGTAVGKKVAGTVLGGKLLGYGGRAVENVGLAGGVLAEAGPGGLANLSRAKSVAAAEKGIVSGMLASPSALGAGEGSIFKRLLTSGFHGLGGLTGGATGMAAALALPALSRLIPKKLAETELGKGLGSIVGGAMTGGVAGAGIMGVNALLPSSLRKGGGTKALTNVGMSAATGSTLGTILGAGFGLGSLTAGGAGALVLGGLTAGKALRGVGGIGGRMASIGTQAAAGAGAGALIGSAVPILGTGIGAAVGGAAGGALGIAQAYNPFSAKGRSNMMKDAKTAWDGIKKGAVATADFVARTASKYNPFTAAGQRNIARAATQAFDTVKRGVAAAATWVVGQAAKFNPFTRTGQRNIISGADAAWRGVKSGATSAFNWTTNAASNSFKWITNAARNTGRAVGSAFTGAWNVTKSVFGWITEAAGKTVKGVVTFFTKTPLGQIMTKPFRDLWSYISALPGNIVKAFSGVASAITKPFTDAFAKITGAPGKVVGGITGAAKSIVGALQHGGVVPRSGNVLVGEAGPELLQLPAGTRVIPNHQLPTYKAQTGTPTRTGGAAAAATTAGGGLFGGLTAAVMKQVQTGIQAITNALTNPRTGMTAALTTTGNAWDDFQKDVHQQIQEIHNDSQWLMTELNKILPEQSKTATDAMTKNFQDTDKNVQTIWTNIVKNTNWGIGQIFKAMANAFKTMGVSVPKEVAGAAGKEKGGRLAQAERGYRLPGAPMGDHIPMVAKGGQVLALADGGELVVNRHTERRVDEKLGAFGTSLGREVAGETKPHWKMPGRATGGRVPMLQTGGVVDQVNAYFSAQGFNKMAIAGILGNAWQESGGNPNTPGGGMWQQISNFGSGTGGSLQAQMAKMSSQIQGLKAALNAAGSPGAAAQIFEQGFEKAGIPAMANRIKYAEAAYAGQLGGAITGGNGSMTMLVAPTINAPNLRGVGAIGALAQGAMGKLTDAANQKLAAAAPAVGGGGGGPGPTFTMPTGPVPAQVQYALQAAQQLANRAPPYGHQGAGWDLGAYDCSSYVSTVMDAAGIWPKWVYYTAAQPINAHTDPGPGKYITIATWGSSGQQAHTMMSIMGQYFESGGGPKGPHRDSGWSQKFDQYRHPAGYAYGGIIDKSDPIRSRHNLLSNTTGGPGSPGYQPTPSEAAAIQRNQMAIKALFAKQHGRAMGGRIDSIEDLLTEQDWRRDGSRKRNVARALGGMVPWFANGADFVAKRPQIIGVGDAPGGERVTVTPQGQGGIGGNVHVEIHNIQVHRKGDVQKIVDEEMRMLAAGLQARM